jgi:uncharacterized protein (TIGR01777 family)
MRIAVTASTGLFGSALLPRLRAAGHDVVPVVRGDQADPAAMWDPEAGWIRPGTFEHVDALVHLSGASIGDGRWSADRKALLHRSRIDSTRLLVDHLAALDVSPATFVCASAVGYYGDRGDEELDESSSTGEGFLAELCNDWEVEARRAEEAGMRPVMLRSGILLSKQGGALAKMLTPFKLGMGGPIGGGHQWLPWVARSDAAAAAEFALTHEALRGPVNVVSPGAVTSRTFVKALGRALHRPAFAPLPSFAVRAIFGEMGVQTLLWGQRPRPAALTEGGFTFGQQELAGALEEALDDDLRPGAAA